MSVVRPAGDRLGRPGKGEDTSSFRGTIWALRLRGIQIDLDLPAPHTITLEVTEADIDAYNHVNNSVYMNWFDRVAWAHSAAVAYD